MKRALLALAHVALMLAPGGFLVLGACYVVKWRRQARLRRLRLDVGKDGASGGAGASGERAVPAGQPASVVEAGTLVTARAVAVPCGDPTCACAPERDDCS